MRPWLQNKGSVDCGVLVCRYVYELLNTTHKTAEAWNRRFIPDPGDMDKFRLYMTQCLHRGGTTLTTPFAAGD